MITMIIGTQGGGKSVQAVLMAKKYIKKGFTVYSNLFIEGTYKIDLEDLMTYELDENCVVVLDEGASMGLGSRGTAYKKNNKDNIIELFTMHRHYKIQDIIVVSPSFSDVLPIIRDNANRILLVKKSLFNLFHFNCVREIGRSVALQSNGGTQEPAMTYFYRGIFPRYYYRKKAYSSYNTYSKRVLFKKEFLKWEDILKNDKVSEETIKNASMDDKNVVGTCRT